MIHVFTATGNSLQIGRALAERTGLGITFINSGGSPDTDDTVFVVCPVYFYNLPAMVREYLQGMDLTDAQKAVLVVNYGTTPGNVLKRAYRDFMEAGIELRYGFGFPMPENYAPIYDAPPPEEAVKLTSQVPEYADYVLAHIGEDSYFEIRNNFLAPALTYFGRPVYDMCRKTRKFRVSDACVSCGLCADICPRHAIELRDGRPVWTEKECEHCCACFHRCPAKAIDYGRTAKKRRYVNPDVELPRSY